MSDRLASGGPLPTSPANSQRCTSDSSSRGTWAPCRLLQPSAAPGEPPGCGANSSAFFVAGELD
eukprot:CAMPEP_0181220704 /NCGR_PEP_ID=MMETSP1096-20121128/28981_1 /TAXON_ID=156174 ORGANISM="Chrysochromulina ericina, Strain CCMP281" /NCGR_SAMPLE_ID=MMETSP1096 /ASSEMBLY_ACC=CAM_ASM_000453 /LENGTH=63 /DNA_ID=CAMNT_0023313229 /DNA_START=1007 /DNA_END=1195 /DNA_ORIENTATION=+